jgi:hypothetical protein
LLDFVPQEKFQRQISEYETARTATENEFHAKQVVIKQVFNIVFFYEFVFFRLSFNWISRLVQSLEKELETVKQQAKEVRAFEKEISALAERSNAAQSKADKEAAKNKEIRAKLDKETVCHLTDFAISKKAII